MTIEIRTAGEDDIPLVHGLMREAFSEYDGVLFPPSGALRETVEDVRARIASGGGAIIVWDGEEPAGCARFLFRETYMYIGRVAVLPSYRGQGVAKAMMAHLEQLACSQAFIQTRVEVRLSLPGNISLYRKLGYEVISEHQYPDGTDGWYMMGKQLTGPQAG